ncbi:hypothetical protein V8E51_014069 [Hyaloscypha variabilis]
MLEQMCKRAHKESLKSRCKARKTFGGSNIRKSGTANNLDTQTINSEFPISMMTSFVPIIPRAEKPKTRRYSAAEWEVQKSNIERLYVTEDRPLKAVIQVLDHDFKFIATEKQLKSRLTQWGFDVKNLKSDIAIELARTKAKRALDNKKSAFRVNKKPVDERKIDRCLQRNDISEEQLLSMASPISAPSPGFSVYTPASVRSHTPDQSDATRLSRSPTPDLNFRTLSLVDQQLPVETQRLPTIAEEKTNVVDEVIELSSPLYTKPEAENGDTSKCISSATLLDGAELIASRERSMIVKNPVVLYQRDESDSNDIFPERGIPTTSLLSSWPTREEADRRWTDHVRHEERSIYDSRRNRVTTSTRVSNTQGLGIGWQPQPVTYSEALEFERQQTKARYLNRKHFPDGDFSCVWFCVSIIPTPFRMYYFEVDVEQDICGGGNGEHWHFNPSA